MSHFPLTVQLLQLGRGTTAVTETLLVPFEFSLGTTTLVFGNSWAMTSMVKRAGDRSGSSVSLSSDGTIVAIGAMDNDGNGDNSGHVRVFAWDDDTSSWEQLGDDIDGEASNDRLGISVSLSSLTVQLLQLGASYSLGGGRVILYSWNTDISSWEQRGCEIVGEAAGDRFGSSLSLSSDGTIVAIGAWANDGNGDNSGHVRVFSHQFLCVRLGITESSNGGLRYGIMATGAECCAGCDELPKA